MEWQLLLFVLVGGVWGLAQLLRFEWADAVCKVLWAILVVVALVEFLLENL